MRNRTNVELERAATAAPSPSADQARDELREGLENSRRLVRQSHLLIELSESDGACPHKEF
jgi:hypothetical protein